MVKTVNDLKKQKYHALKNEDDYLYQCLSYEETFLAAENPVLYHEAEKVLLADRARSTRLKRRILKYMGMGDCVFLTLTFRDDVLECTSADTRRQYVLKYLKSCSNYYVANIDFGSQNEREHYHAIVVTDHVDMSKWFYGFSYAEKIIKSSDSLRLAHYLNKLVNHAVKETCRRCHIIYSRDTQSVQHREEFYDEFVKPYMWLDGDRFT